MEGESTVTDAAIVDHTLGAPILEFNRQCGISGVRGHSHVCFLFSILLGSRRPKEWVCSNGRRYRGPEHMVKGTGSKDRVPKFKS